MNVACKQTVLPLDDADGLPLPPVGAEDLFQYFLVPGIQKVHILDIGVPHPGKNATHSRDGTSPKRQGTSGPSHILVLGHDRGRVLRVFGQRRSRSKGRRRG